ncbi:hypothetical protein [Streptococcus thermophilus]|uniref:hypothetical protein n=1 Tax=Streptococcus thermophilus TaxID=1308 RepID=UPI0035D08E06
MEAYMKNKFRFLGVQKKQFSERLKESFLSLSLRIQLTGLLWKSVGSTPTVSFNILLWVIWTKRRRSLDLKIFQN